MMTSIPFHATALLLTGAGFLSIGNVQAGGQVPQRLQRLSNVCGNTSELAFFSSMNQIEADYLIGLGGCINMLDLEARADCIDDAIEERDEAVQLLQEQHQARLDLCSDLGPGAYNPVIDPANFVSGVDNPLMPLVIGRSLVYEAQTDEGLEVVTVTVLDETRTIMGVECIVVKDVVTLDGELVEDTDDWFAQDAQGNVWYFGEISLNYEDDRIVDIDGSWEAGVDGAQAGIVMQAVPAPGMVYRLEFLLGEAEDAARVELLNVSVNIPFGSFANCLQTEDFSPLEPDAIEEKFYAPGIGLVLETKPDEDERLELVAIIDN